MIFRELCKDRLKAKLSGIFFPMQILPVFSSQIVFGGVGWFVFRELRFGVVITVLVYFFFFKQKLEIHECVLYPLERKTNKKKPTQLSVEHFMFVKIQWEDESSTFWTKLCLKRLTRGLIPIK